MRFGEITLYICTEYTEEDKDWSRKWVLLIIQKSQTTSISHAGAGEAKIWLDSHQPLSK